MRVRSGVHRKGIQKCGGMTLPFFISIFGGATTAGLVANFYYTTPRPICQEENRKKIKKYFFPKRLDKYTAMCYN
jgi:hypothetical protein